MQNELHKADIHNACGLIRGKREPGKTNIQMVWPCIGVLQLTVTAETDTRDVDDRNRQGNR